MFSVSFFATLAIPCLETNFLSILSVPPTFSIFDLTCLDAKFAVILILFFKSPSPNIFNLIYFLFIIFFVVKILNQSDY